MRIHDGNAVMFCRVTFNILTLKEFDTYELYLSLICFLLVGGNQVDLMNNRIVFQIKPHYLIFFFRVSIALLIDGNIFFRSLAKLNSICPSLLLRIAQPALMR